MTIRPTVQTLILCDRQTDVVCTQDGLFFLIRKERLKMEILIYKMCKSVRVDCGRNNNPAPPLNSPIASTVRT